MVCAVPLPTLNGEGAGERVVGAGHRAQSADVGRRAGIAAGIGVTQRRRAYWT